MSFSSKENSHMSDSRPGKRAETGIAIPESQTIQEDMKVRDSLAEQYKNAEKEEKINAKKEKARKEAEEQRNSLWGQMDTAMAYLGETSYDMPEEPKPKPAPAKKLTKKELEQQSDEKMRLFSEFVAADAEASTPVVKKEDPMAKPLHFKYYQNDGESLVEQTTDEILGEASA